MLNAITDVEGIQVGHWTDSTNATGCTVILAPPEGAVAGVDVRGPAPGTRETELLRPGHLVQRINAVLLTGGSAFGLDAAAGVVRFLEEKGIGFDTGVARVPIVPAAVIFDLSSGDGRARPNADSGYRACVAASNGAVAQGSVGAGTGAHVGRLLGPRHASKGGVGTASQQIGKGIVVGALVVVNAFGDVVDPRTGDIIAGAFQPGRGGWLNSAEEMKRSGARPAHALTCTTIGVVATNARLTKEEANLVAMMAHDGLARAIRPSHTLYDGDTLFVMATGKQAGDVSAVGHTAAEVIADAIVRAVSVPPVRGPN